VGWWTEWVGGPSGSEAEASADSDAIHAIPNLDASEKDEKDEKNEAIVVPRLAIAVLNDNRTEGTPHSHPSHHSSRL
jgi:hypothetical protein